MTPTRLLVSVRNSAEALQALSGGAELIDVKEPDLGSLGAASPGTWRAVAKAVGQKVPLSAAWGELSDITGVIRSAEAVDELRMSLAGYQFVKLGLAGMAARSDWAERWQHAWAELPRELVRVAVAYADWQQAGAPSPETVISVGAAVGCGALLLDTYDKRGGSLFDHLASETIGDLLRNARMRGWTTVLAGSLNDGLLSQAVAQSPDWLAVRGAVCAGQRRGMLCGDRVSAFRRRLRQRVAQGQAAQLAQCDRTG